MTPFAPPLRHHRESRFLWMDHYQKNWWSNFYKNVVSILKCFRFHDNFVFLIKARWMLFCRIVELHLNLWTTTTHGTPKLWPCRCSEAALCYKNLRWDPNQNSGRCRQVVVNSGLTVLPLYLLGYDVTTYKLIPCYYK